MSAIRWTPENDARLLRMIASGTPFRNIGAALGGTACAIRVRVNKLRRAGVQGIVVTTKGNRGIPHSPEAKAKIAAGQKAAWSDDGVRERRTKAIRTANRQPERCQKLSAYQDRRRGFSIPAEKRDEYHFLTNNMKLKAQEAKSVLCLPDHPQAIDRRPWTAEDDRELAELWRSGMLTKQIAPTIGRTLHSVNDRVRRDRKMFPPRPCGAKPVGHMAIDKPIVALRRKGLTVEAIALELGIGMATVSRRLKAVLKQEAA